MAGISISKKNKKKGKKAAKKDSGRAQSEEAIRAMREDFNVDAEEEPGPKKSYRKFVFVGAAVLLIATAAGGAWLFVLQPTDDVEVDIAEVEPEVFPKAYIEPAPVHISFRQADGSRRRMIVYLLLEVEQRDGHVAQVRKALPRLQEAYWRILNDQPLPGAESGSIELTDVKDRLLDASENLLGPHIVNNVLIQDARTIRG